MFLRLFALLAALSLTVDARAGAGPGMPLSQRAARLLAQAGRGLAEERRGFRAPVRTGDDDEYRPILGGITDADEDDPDVVNAAKFAVSQLEATDGSDRALRLANVVDAKQQVVAGMKYYLTTHVHRTTCPEGSPNAEDLDACPTALTQQCDFQVWDQPWREQSLQMTQDPDCQSIRG